ncbi:MAG: hypothetical protein U5K30_08175 [Acidimicrobiales bacterium]|nr:hypothetical protein [Acidimicrobiales bacterium]
MGRLVEEAGERVLDRVLAEPEVRLDLRADGDQRRVLALGPLGGLVALGHADGVGVVATAQAAIAADHDGGDRADLLGLVEQRCIAPGAGVGEVADHLGDLLGVGTGGEDALLRLDDPAGGDELHRLGDLPRRLHRLDASAEDAFLASGHELLVSSSS